jgi:hypothetical protein
MGRLAGEKEPNEKKSSVHTPSHPWSCFCGCWFTLIGVTLLRFTIVHPLTSLVNDYAPFVFIFKRQGKLVDALQPVTCHLDDNS